MADAPTPTPSHEHFKRLKENFPIIGEILTSLVGAMSNEALMSLWRSLFGKARESADKFIRTQLPDFMRSMVDEGMFCMLMEQLTDTQKKAVEGYFARKTNHKQRVDIILSMAEMLLPPLPPGMNPDTPEAREMLKTERAKAFAAAVGYLKYLADLGDDDKRTASLLSRNFMRKRNEYKTSADLIQTIREYIDVVDNSGPARRLRVINRAQTRANTVKRAELARPMTWRERLSFFSLFGR